MILGLMLVKESDDAERALASLKGCCDDVYVHLDDSPGRWSVPEWVLRQPLLDEAARVKADWAVTLDADEWLTNPAALRDDLVRAEPGVASYWIQRYNLWGDGRCKTDWLCRVWRPKDGHIIERRHVGTASCPNSVCHEGRCEYLVARRCSVLHDGYDTEAKRKTKIAEYRAVDPHWTHLKRNMSVYFGMDGDTDLVPVPDFVREAPHGTR